MGEYSCAQAGSSAPGRQSSQTSSACGCWCVICYGRYRKNHVDHEPPFYAWLTLFCYWVFLRSWFTTPICRNAGTTSLTRTQPLFLSLRIEQFQGRGGGESSPTKAFGAQREVRLTEVLHKFKKQVIPGSKNDDSQRLFKSNEMVYSRIFSNRS